MDWDTIGFRPRRRFSPVTLCHTSPRRFRTGLEINLAEIGNTAGFDADALKLAKAFGTMFRHLDLEPKSTAVNRFFAAAASRIAFWLFGASISR